MFAVAVCMCRVESRQNRATAARLCEFTPTKLQKFDCAIFVSVMLYSQVPILDSAVIASATYAQRYLTGHLLSLCPSILPASQFVGVHDCAVFGQIVDKLSLV